MVYKYRNHCQQMKYLLVEFTIKSRKVRQEIFLNNIETVFERNTDICLESGKVANISENQMKIIEMCFVNLLCM